MRRIGEFLIWLAGWSAFLALAGRLIVSPQRVSVIWIGGGLAAGVLLLRPMGTWWLVLGPFALALAGWSVSQDLSDVTVLVRAVSDVAAIALYALVITRHRVPTAGLGSTLGWVSVAALAAAAVRWATVWALVLLVDVPEAQALRQASTELFVGTLVGLVAGSASVLGIFGWTRSTNRALRDPFVPATALVGAVLVVVVFLTPVGAALPGSEYVIVPVLLVMAMIAPGPLTALVVGLTLLVIAASTANSLGVYQTNPAVEPSEILTVQLYLLTITVAAFLLASLTDERRRARAQAAHSAAVMSTVFRDLPTAAAWVTVDDGRPLTVRQANPAFLSLLELREADARNASLTSLLAPTTADQEVDLTNGRDLQVVRPSGSTLWLRPTLSHPEPGGPEVDEFTGDPATSPAAVLVLEDVTDIHASEELLRLRARRDSLTKLPSRLTFIEQLQTALGAAERPCDVVLFIVDVDGLKAVNHSFGPEVGDQVLIEVVRRLALVIDGADLLARTAGDELAILRRAVAGDEAPLDFADRVLAVVREPFRLGDLSIAVTVSIGVAQSGASAVTWNELMRWAEIAVRNAKSAGRDRVSVFDPHDDPQQGDRLHIGQQLREVVATGDLVCLFQPLLDISSGAVTSAELLVRMRAGNGEVIAPERFLHLADNMGLMGPITEYVLRQACEAALHWHRAGTDVRVAFNAPPAWLSSAAVGLIDREIKRSGVPRGLITVEVTEERALNPGGEAYAALANLRATGVHVAIDDFGTGYSGLHSFRSSPADIVKVDKAFVADMLRTDPDLEIVRSILDLIHRFGKTSVAEGVETDEQLRALDELGCNYAQGYIIGRPMTAEQFPAGSIRQML